MLSLFWFLLSQKKFVDIFLKIDKTILKNWCQNLDDKLIRKCIESVFQSLDSRLIYDRP